MKYEELSDNEKTIVNFCNSSKFLERLKKEVKDFIVFKEKHGDRYFKFESFVDAQDVSLRILEDRIDYFDLEDEPQIDITWEDVEKLPESLKEAAKIKIKYYEAELKRVLEENEQYNLAHYALEEKNGFLAWWIIRNRCDYQYENYSIEKFEKV